jgi:ribonuclease HI
MSTNYDVTIWTDGSNDKEGHGGCAAVCVAKSGKRHIETWGVMEGATNQTMELMAAIIGLRRCWWDLDPLVSGRKRRSKRVLIYSDSAYLTNCFIQEWIPNWRRRGWRKGDGKPVANRWFWETLESLVIDFKEVKFVHIKGHAGNVNNELADREANKARVSMAARELNSRWFFETGRKDELAPDAREFAEKHSRKRPKRRPRRRS